MSGTDVDLETLRAALEADGLLVGDVDGGLGLAFDDDGREFDLLLDFVDGDLVATIVTPTWEIEPDVLARVTRWLDAQNLTYEVQRDDDGDPSLWFWDGIEKPAAEALSPWVRGLADAVGAVLQGLEGFLDGIDEEVAVLRAGVDLHESGQTLAAIAELERVLPGIDPRSAPRAHGLCLASLGDLLCQVGRYDEAALLLERSLDVLLVLGEERVAALSELSLLAIDTRAGRVTGALERCERLAEELARVGVPDDVDLVECRRGQLLAQLDRAEEAVTVLGRLEARLSAAAEPSPHLAHARSGLAAALELIGNHDAAVDMLDAAEDLYRARHQEVDVVRCGVSRVGLLVRIDPAKALTLVPGLRAEVERLGSDELSATLDTHESLARRAAGEAGAAGELARRAHERLGATGAGSSAEAVMATMNAALMAYEAGDFPAAIAGAEAAVERFEQLGMPVLLARCLTNLALVRMGALAMSGTARVDELELPLGHALAAVDLLARHPQRFRSVADRGRWAAELSNVYLLAACQAHALGRHRLVAELLERVRSQGLPDVDATTAPTEAGPLDAGDDFGSWDGAEAAEGTGSAPAAESPGRRELLDAVRSSLHDLSVTVPEVTDVAAATRAVGGPGAWRWTLWQASGLLLWAVVEPGGRAHSGFVAVEAPLREGGANPMPAWADAVLPQLQVQRLRPALDRLRDALGVDLDSSRRGREVVAGPLFEDVDDREPADAWELGRLLVPDVLAGQLRRRLRHRAAAPLPLVVAPSPGLARLPFALLALEPPSASEPLGRRLVEAATVTIAPPSGLVDALAVRPRAPGPRPVRVAVVDPTDDLQHCAVLLDRERGAATVFGGRDVRTKVADAAAPDREAIVAALRAGSAGAPGVLVWAGHAVPGADGEALEAGWELPVDPMAAAGADGGDRGDGDLGRLRVKDLLLAGLHAPSRALLYGCSTVGGSDELNEWWGLPVGVLFAGASSVLACAWDMVDCPAGAALAGELLTLAVEGDDLATGLREVQLRWLRDWAARRPVDRRFRGDADDRHPHLWAAWSVVGVHRG